MGNSSSSTSGAAAITVAAVAAAATAAWVFSSYLSSEIMEPQNRSSEIMEPQNRSSETKESQNRSSETKESQNRLSETTQDLNCLHVEGNFGASPIYDPETKASLSGNEVHVDQHITHGSEFHPSTYTQLDHIQTSKVKVVRHNFKSNEGCKQKEEVVDQNSWKSKAKRKLKSKAKRKLKLKAKRKLKSKAHSASLVTGVQAESSQIGSKKLKRKRKLKADSNTQIPRHLTPNIYFQETIIKIMSYNIWSIKYYKRGKRMKAVNHLIEQHSPDIILLQEVTPEIYRYFQTCTWWGIYKCSIEGKQATRQCFCMMLCKLPVEEFFYKQFVNTKTCKGVSVAKFTSKSNIMLAVATCHLKRPDGPCTYDIERASQAKEAIDLLNFSPNVVLGGDMNWDELTDGPFPLTSGWHDAWPNLKPEEHGYTYDTESNAMLRHSRRIVQKRLDRFVCKLEDFDMIDIEIVGTTAIEGVSCKSKGEKLPLLPSDHYGLILTICAK